MSRQYYASSVVQLYGNPRVISTIGRLNYGGHVRDLIPTVCTYVLDKYVLEIDNIPQL